MASDSKKRSSQGTSAEISLIHLQRCLVNLPSSLSSLLDNVNTLAQNVIVELVYQVPPSPSSSISNEALQPRSVFVGWTGMQSRRKLAPIINRDGTSSTRGNAPGRDQQVQLVEIDAAFARTIGLSDGQKVTASLHLDAPIAHTVHIEPLTPADWEIIELHADFLETNLIWQIRALPNPNYISPNKAKSTPHPLTLYLSPTSTANIIVTSILPALPSDSPFAKLSPDAEVIVAPKTRPKSSRAPGENGSVSSRRSGRSGAATVRRKSGRGEEPRPAAFFRGLDRNVCSEYFEEAPDTADEGLKVWVDREVMLSNALKGITWACVTVIKPASLQVPVDLQNQQQEIDRAGDASKITSKVVARLVAWDDPPDSHHIALSSALCVALGCEGIVGGVVMVEPAPLQISKDSSQLSLKANAQQIKIYPFDSSSGKPNEGLKFGSASKAEREVAAQRIIKMYSQHGASEGLLDGPITDGSILGPLATSDRCPGWEGGIIRFDHAPSDSGKQSCNWFLGSERKLAIEIQTAIPQPWSLINTHVVGDPLPLQVPVLVGIDDLLQQLQSHLSHMSSVLLTGSLGAGKSSVAHLVAHRLRSEKLFHTTYFSCRQLVTDETRISAIKETFTRVFMGASWGARLGGRSVVILDDLDKLCPVETELEVGRENGRSKQISEIVCALVRQYCNRDSGVVLLVTAQAKESLHNVIVSLHVVREILGLKAPNKEGRRRITETLVQQNTSDQIILEENGSSLRPTSADGSIDRDEDGMWTDGFKINQDLDFLDLAGETDGYMPGDLVLLVARARNEALMRSIAQSLTATDAAMVQICKEDFKKALKGFTAASLRNITLQTSTTTFDSIGGLQETRRVLLETLQYPTTYAPIFAQCPLRLRSGLLLYGYPGCGKTLLASAVAGECGLNFISVKGPEILNKYIGASEKSVRDLFDRAEAARPCVLFFDEFDSIAPKRGHDSTGVTDRVVNQLLTQMDGAEGLSGVYVLAATSRPDLIDPALLRPGRLDKSLLCDLPDLEDRIDILKALSKKLKLSHEVQDGPQGGLAEIARRTDGYSGADLQALVYNAHLEAIHDVLGDQDHADMGKKLTDTRNGPGGAASKAFMQFIYGEEEHRREIEALSTSGRNRSKAFAEKATISMKLEQIKKAEKRAKLAQRGQRETKQENEPKEEKDEQEVMVMWKHIEKSLQSTRASIGAEEKKRLQGIYNEFIVGRNGEMPNGQGGTEVGGRTSLM